MVPLNVPVEQVYVSVAVVLVEQIVGGVGDGVRVEEGVAVPVRVVVEDGVAVRVVVEDGVDVRVVVEDGVDVPVGVADKEGVVLKLTQEAVRPAICVITPLCSL